MRACCSTILLTAALLVYCTTASATTSDDSINGGSTAAAATSVDRLITARGPHADQLKNPTHYGPPLPKPLPPGHGPPVSCQHDESPQFIMGFACNMSIGGKPPHCRDVIRQFCAPRAKNGTICPTDVPPGNITNGAKPKTFESDPGKTSCFLSCTRNSDCGGGAVCENKTLGTGACTWIVNGSTDGTINGISTTIATKEMEASNDVVACVGSSAMLAPTECAAMQQLFSGWNMTHKDCNVRDPCSCKPPCRMGPCAVYCDADADGTGYVQGMSLTAVNPPLQGTISEAIGNLTRLNIMFLDVNQISGTIPSVLANMKNLNSINLLANQLSGTIPAGLQSTPWAGTTGLFYVGCNALTGTVPAMDLKNVKKCDLGDDPAFCKNFGPRSSNNFKCPLPDGAVENCNAKCS
jgi:hypothetical protein